jgi:hypothetical protein
MDMLPLEDDHVFVKDQDTPKNTDISTTLDVIFPMDSSCELDQQVDETVIPGVGIVSSFLPSSFLLFTIFGFLDWHPFGTCIGPRLCDR